MPFNFTICRKANHFGILPLTGASLTTSLKLTQKRCELRCTCACHIGEVDSRALIFLKTFLFRGIRPRRGPHRLAIMPNVDIVQRKSPTLVPFHSGSGNRILLVNLDYKYTKGPKLCLRLPRVRSKEANIFYLFGRGF